MNVLLAAVVVGIRVPPVGPDSFALGPCQLGALPARCGTYWVYEDRARGSGRRIPLKIIVLPARSETPAPDPVLFVSPGGPGTTNSEAAIGLAAASPLRDRRDMVVVDLRGTSGSNRLDCEDGAPATMEKALESLFDRERIRACRSRLEQVADLSLYTTPAIVDDLDEVRKALGIRQVNLLGMSWGTRAVLVYMRRHPKSVRSAIMLGVVPLAYKYPLPVARGAQRSLDALFARCLRDQACRDAFPDVRDEFAAILARLRRSPVSVTTLDPFARDTTTFTLTEPSFVDALRAALYAPARQARLPFEIHEAAGGEFGDLIRDLAGAAGGQHVAVRLGFLLSVSCSEDGARIDSTAIADETRDTFTGDYRIRDQLAACALWPYRALPSEDAMAVSSGIPSLLISGAEDPVTPPEWGVEAASRLSRSIHLIVHGGHVPGGACVAAVERAFVEAGSPKGVDMSCSRDTTIPPFVLR